VRSDGFAITDEELELGLRSIAVPVRTHQHKVVGAMNIGVQAARVSAAEIDSSLSSHFAGKRCHVGPVAPLIGLRRRSARDKIEPQPLEF